MPDRRTRTKWAVGLVTTAVAAGTLAGASAHAIGGGGVPTDGSYGFVAKIDFGGVRACTGALIDPNWVVTAKGCFSEDGQPVAEGAPSRVTTATIGRTDLTTSAGHLVAITSLVPHPDRNLVLAELAAPVTDIAAVPLGAAPVDNEALSVAGYGRTADEWVPNKLHTATFTVRTHSATAVEIVGASANAAICKGDAGGPAVREVGGRIELVAINNTSWQKGCLGETDTRPESIETRVDDLGGWIGQQLVEQPYGLAYPVTGEFNRDAYQDLLGVESGTGRLWLYPGTATPGTWGRRILAGARDWQGMSELVAGRYNRDSYDDLLAVENSTGKMWLYPGTANGVTFGDRVEIGDGWIGLSKLVGGEFNRDGYDDVIAVHNSTGQLFFYAGTPAGGRFADSKSVGKSGWTAFQKLVSGRFNRDPYDDLLAVETDTGKLVLYPGAPAGNTDWANPTTIGDRGWEKMGGLVAGQYNADQFDDLLAVETATEQVRLYPGTTAGGPFGDPVSPGGRLPTPKPTGVTSLLTGEFNRDSYPDLVGLEPLSGRLWLYPGTATGVTFGRRIQIGEGWFGFGKLVVGRFNRDEYDDLMAVFDSTGALLLYPGTATGPGFGPRVQVGASGWNAFSQLVAGKFDRDQYDDLLAVETATDTLKLYAGSATNGGADWARPVTAASGGWNPRSELTAGRFNRDEYDDLLAIETATGKLWLYPGTAAGTTWGTKIELPGSWSGRRDLVAGRFNRDAYDDLLAVDSATGKLVLYPGTASGGGTWGQPVEVGGPGPN